jgi:hypothetical protein
MTPFIARLAPLLLVLCLALASCRPQTVVPPPRPAIIDTDNGVEATDDEPVDPEADVETVEAEVDEPTLDDDPVLGDDEEDDGEPSP